MELFDVLGMYQFWLCLICLGGVYYYVHRTGFESGVIAGVEKTLDELVKEGLIYMDEREELKRRDK